MLYIDCILCSETFMLIVVSETTGNRRFKENADINN